MNGKSALAGQSFDKAGILRKILLIGLASAILYCVLNLSQRGIFLDGLRRSIAVGEKLAKPGIGSSLIIQIFCYYGVIIGLFATYSWIIVLCQRGELDNKKVRNLALLFPVLINLGFLFVRPYLSIDLYSYVAQGYLGIIPGHNPYSEEAKAVLNTTLGPRLVEYGWRPVHGITPYGALWTELEIAAVKMTGNISTAILLIKTLVVAASLATATLIWRILGRIDPKAQLLGTLLYLWNPMIIVEFAAEGHNDAVMIMFVLAAFLFCVSRRLVLSIVAVLLGVFTKYLPLIFIPAQVVYLWEGRRDWKRFVSNMMLGLLIGFAIALLLYSPLWIGLDTFKGVFLQGQPNQTSTLPSGVLLWLLRHLVSAERDMQISARIIGIFYGILVMAFSLALRDKSRLRTVFAYIALSYVLLGASTYLPWYVGLPFALLALSPSGTSLIMALVVSFCSRLVAPLDVLTYTGLLSVRGSFIITSTVGTTLPLLILVVLIWRGWRKGMPASTLSQ